MTKSHRALTLAAAVVCLAAGCRQERPATTGAVILDIDTKGQISMGGTPLTMSEARNALRQEVAARNTSDFPATIRAEADTSHRHVKRALDICAATGIYRYSLALAGTERTVDFSLSVPDPDNPERAAGIHIVEPVFDEDGVVSPEDFPPPGILVLDSGYVMDGQEIDIAGIEEYMTATCTGTAAIVTVFLAEHSRHVQVIDLVEACRRAGVQNFDVCTLPPARAR
jgi:biopolymer transport protein ExbD